MALSEITRSGVSELFLDNSNNRVGLGTDLPADALHINNSSGDVAVRIQGNTRTYKLEQNNYGFRIYDVDASTERFRITAAGDLEASLAYSSLPAGTILQIVQSELTTIPSFASVTAFTDVGLSATITPKFSSSKVLVQVNAQMGNTVTPVNYGCRLLRGTTPVGNGVQTTGRQAFSHYEQNIGGTQYQLRPHVVNFFDSPATTSATTYKIQVAQNTSGATVYLNRPDNYSAAQANTRSTITLFEVAA